MHFKIKYRCILKLNITSQLTRSPRWFMASVYPKASARALCSSTYFLLDNQMACLSSSSNSEAYLLLCWSFHRCHSSTNSYWTAIAKLAKLKSIMLLIFYFFLLWYYASKRWCSITDSSQPSLYRHSKSLQLLRYYVRRTIRDVNAVIILHRMHSFVNK